MKIIIIGAVASGTSAGAKARRNNDSAEITIYEKDKFISYSGCGMPYYIGDEVEDINSLVPRDPTFFKKKYNIDVKTGYEVLSINPTDRTVQVKNLATDELITDCFDKLVIATGAKANIPSINGISQNHVFSLRNIRDVLKIKEFVKTSNPKNAVILGSGFIGFEVLENLLALGIEVKMLESTEKICPNLDADMSIYFEAQLNSIGVQVRKNTKATDINADTITLDNGDTINADLVIVATGVAPNIELAKHSGIEIGSTGAIRVNNKMQTNLADIYACGDCIETYCSITKKPVYRPLGSTANKTGRIAGDVITGGSLEYKGNLSTSIFKFQNITVANTGLTEKLALQYGYDIQICHNIKPDKSLYLGGKEMLIKGIADKNTSRILGVQIIGSEGVDKRIDIFATLITYNATVDELFHLDLAYAPPFSTTKDPVHYTGMILDNAINSERKLITLSELESLDEKVQIIDTRSSADFEKKGTVKGAVSIPQAKLRENISTLDKDVTTITFCNKGVTGNASQNILLNHGFKRVYNLSGGHKFYKASHKNDK